MTNPATVLAVSGLHVEHRTLDGHGVQAVSGVDLAVSAGETLGLVGESGCGKSSLAAAVMMLTRPTSGTVEIKGLDVGRLRGARLRSARRDFQMVFQDPRSSLNPRHTVAQAVGEGLSIQGVRGDRGLAVGTALDLVGLDPGDFAHRRVTALSGGQSQRVAIARVLALRPSLVVCDEPVSALDVSVQAQVLEVLCTAQADLGFAMLFISHDLAVVNAVSDRVAVMYMGRLCETGPTSEVLGRPRHPYTETLLAAVPRLVVHADDGGSGVGPAIGASGEPASNIDPPSGCRYRTRCGRATEICANQAPELLQLDGSSVACHHPLG